MTQRTASEGLDHAAARPSAQPPVPLHLDFELGKGFLRAEDVDVADWLTLETLRMEIPDLSFPFDAGGGVDRFRDTRCRVREIAVTVDEAAFARRVRRAAEHLDEFASTRVAFLDDAVHVSLRLDAFGSESALSFRAALVPPEPPRADELHLSLYDYRWFGPLPYPGRLLAFEWLTSVLDHPLFTAHGRGRPYQVGIAGDIASFRPFKLLLLELFPRAGWKMPDLSNLQLEVVRVEPGTLTIGAADPEFAATRGGDPVAALRESREGRRALAAYESKDLFAPADEALFDGEVDGALAMLDEYRNQYGLHPHLASRILDGLLASPSQTHLAQAREIARTLVDHDADDLRGHLARPLLTRIETGDEAALEAYDTLASLLESRGDTPDRLLAEMAAADILADESPERAASRLRDVLEASPRNVDLLERLRTLYRRLGDHDRLEEILERLTAARTERDALRETYVDLARHLLHRAGEVGEARHYLRKALEIDDEDVDALEALGETYTLSDQPMRAVKVFASAARRAEARDEPARARELHFRIASVWRDELDDPEQALLSVRRAIGRAESEFEAASNLNRPQAIEYARQLEFAAEICEQLDRLDEALGHWSEVVNLLERIVDADDVPTRPVGDVDSPTPSSPPGRLARAHDRRAALYRERGRMNAARHHWERVLELDPGAEEVADELAGYYRRNGETDALVDLLRHQLRTVSSRRRSAALHDRLADVFERTGDEELAAEHRSKAESFGTCDGETDNPFREHRAETAPLVADSDPEEPPPETTDESPDDRGESAASSSDSPPPERAVARDGDSAPARDLVPPDDLHGHDLPESGATTEPLGEEAISTSKDSEDSRDDFEDLASQLAEARARADDGDSTDADDDASNTFDTSSETRTLDGSSSVIEAERRRHDENSLPDDDGSGELEEFRDEYRDLLDSAGEASSTGGPDVTPADTDEDDRDGDLDVPEPDSLATGEGEDGESTAEQLVERARRADDPADRAAALEEALDRYGGSADALSEERALEVRRRLAELLYYELEDAEAARPHLEALHRRDPDGAGAKPDVLRALETIYERSGETDARIEVLRRRLETTDDPDMQQNFRLLLARLYWREHDDATAAETLLEETLREAPDHEGAHRLLAELRRDQGDWEQAAEHLERLLDLVGGGLDALELERDYANLLLDHLDRPEEAADHYRAVLDETPGDDRALEGLQQASRASGDWKGYLEGLGYEVGVLLGRTSPLAIEAMAELDGDDVGAESAMPVNGLLTDAAEVALDHLENPELARRYFGAAYRVWPEHVEALERRIELDRRLDRTSDLAEDLVMLANALLDPSDRYGALAEAGELFFDELDDADRAVEQLERALAAADDADSSPEDLGAVRDLLDRAREASNLADAR